MLAYTAHAFSGFGSIIISVTLGSLIYPIDVLLPVLVPLDIILNTYLVIKYRKKINVTVLFKKILPFMGAGMAVGIFIFNFFHNPVLKNIFGIFVVLVSIKELIMIFNNKLSMKPLGKRKSTAWVLAGGIIHGIYASGGPLVVYPLSRILSDKSIFRSTLAALWLTLNTVLATSYTITGKITIDTIKWIGVLVLLIPLSILAGEKLHHKLDEKKFRIVIYLLLLIAGISVALNS